MEFYIQIASGALQIVIAVIGLAFSAMILPWVREFGIPWLKEKRIYTLVTKFVQAAEKMGETGAIEKCDKKKYVIKLLMKHGIDVTDEVDAFIESAVEELEFAIDCGVEEVIHEFHYEPDEYQECTDSDCDKVEG